MTSENRERVEAHLPPISPLVLRFFRRIVRRYFRRHFRTVHMQGVERMRNAQGPLIIFANHASWWDPMVSVLLGNLLLPGRRHYAPMDAIPLQRYGILRHIGIFPVEMSSRSAAAQFLGTAQAVLASGGVLWITPQGRFADVRERPLRFKAGLALLVARVPGLTLLPLAIEYTFWDERLPETLLRAGEPIQVEATMDTKSISAALERALEDTMDDLRAAALTRDPLQFDVLLEGSRGTGGFYALGKRIAAAMRGRAPQEDHSARDARVGAVTRR